MKTEAKIKKYIRSLGRRLNLPKDLRRRLLSDLNTTISARLEGEPWESIQESLGTPKAVASGYMKEMGEYAYRKSPWRFACAAVAAYGMWNLLENLLVQGVALGLSFAIHPGGMAAMGVIGGADGPTAVFVTTPGWTHWLPACVLTAAGLWGYLRLRKCNK